mmetsp:Transcript_35910/g.75604  ORF Transcript_35910/g.75604 Transcript_35910/m.75604 type:complete len:237 (-) Transcript_35910:186-896(-)
MIGTVTRHIRVICQEKYKATARPPNPPKLACNPSPNLMLNPSSKSIVYSANAATTSPGRLSSKNAISCANTAPTYAFLTRFVILAAPYGMALIPTNAAAPKITARRAMMRMVSMVPSNMEPETEERSSRISPKTRFIMAKERPTQLWTMTPTKRMSLSLEVPWRKRERKGMGVASAYLSSLALSSLSFLLVLEDDFFEEVEASRSGGSLSLSLSVTSVVCLIASFSEAMMAPAMLC